MAHSPWLTASSVASLSMPITDPLWPRADTWLASDSADPDLLVVGVPTSVVSLVASEAWRCPGEVRSALSGFSVFDGERGNDLRAVAVSDLGDFPVDGLDAEAMSAGVERLAAGRAPG